MEFISDEDITNHLDKHGIPHSSAPYTRIQNNNNAVTDSHNFFLKMSTSEVSLELELETTLQLSDAPKPLIKEIVFIKGTPTITMQYIAHSPITPEGISLLPTETINNLALQILSIKTLNPANYKNLRELKAIHNLINQRLAHPNLNAKQVKQLEEINNLFITPYVQKYNTHKTLSHTDVKLENMLLLSPTKVLLIDYESIKPAPTELDLASLYQDLYQTGYPAEYALIANQLEALTFIDEALLVESILFKNAVTTTAAVRLKDPTVLNQRLEILLDPTHRHTAPERLIKVELSQAQS